MRRWSRVIGPVVVALAVTLLPAAAVAAPAPPTFVTKPAVSGTAQYGSTVRAAARWEPTDAVPTYQWLRDGKAITGRTGTTLKLGGSDVAHRISVRVTVTGGDGQKITATSPSVSVTTKPLTRGSKPTISGERRYRKTLTANPGTWKASGLSFRYRWFRDGKPIKGQGSTKRTRVMSHLDVGKKMSVRVTARKAHHTKTMGPTSNRTAVVRHLRDPRRTVTYSVVNDGSRLNMGSVRGQVAKIYADARGWRKGAVKFKRVSRGGSFTLVLARAERVPRYSSHCSVKWSCRVGRNVIINEDRWRGATRAWRGAGKSVTSYRHMVVNHETGHWFGKGHVGCKGRGRTAPVMMQQSKGLNGCKPNPFPLDSEAASVVRR